MELLLRGAYMRRNVKVKCPTEVSNNQLENKRSQIEKECNRVWLDICERRIVGKNSARLFHITNITLSVLYTLIKNRKISTLTSMYVLSFLVLLKSYRFLPPKL